MGHGNEKNPDVERKKRFLKRYRKNQSCIEQLRERIKDLDDRIKTVRSPNYSGMPRGGTPVTSVDLLAEKDELERRLKNRLEKSDNYKREIHDEIDTLDDPTQVDILEKYFIDCMEFEDIADELGYNMRHVTRLYARAIYTMVNNDIFMT